MIRKHFFKLGILLLLLWLVSACVPKTSPPPIANPESTIAVPELPFGDNPDPTQCGIPIQWGKNNQAWLNGFYEGKLIQPTVFLYDSHLRNSVTGSALSGTEVEILLYQQNPVLDFYLVQTVNIDPPQEGWVPSPFLQFEPVAND